MRIKDVQYISTSHSWSTQVGIPSDSGAMFNLDVLKAVQIWGIVNE